MMIRIQELRPSFVRVNPGDKSENRLYKAVPLNFWSGLLERVHHVHSCI